MRIVFFGTPYIAAEFYRTLVSHAKNIVAVVSKPDKQMGRNRKSQPTALKKVVQEITPHIPILQPEKASSEEFYKQLEALQPDLFVVVAFGEILKKPLLEIPKIDCINVHASYLPELRGASPIQSAIITGLKKTGVTIMRMVLKMDAGPIYSQKTIPIPEEMNAGQLQEKMIEVGGPLLLEVMNQLENGGLTPKEQDESKATYVKKIHPEDLQLDWNRPSHELHNLVRGLAPKPGAWSLVEHRGQPKRLKILKTAIRNDLHGLVGETIVYSKEGWIVGCAQGALQLLEIQLEGKKVMFAEDFIKGYSEPPLFIK